MGTIMTSRAVVRYFIDALATAQNSRNPLALRVSNKPAFELPSGYRVIEGADWASALVESDKFDFIVVDLPLGMSRKKIKFGYQDINIRANWVELAKALDLLMPSGLCVALVEPAAFGFAEGPKFLEALRAKGYQLNGIFNTPPNLLATTSIRPVLVAFSREKLSDLFVAELEEGTQASAVAAAFIRRVGAGSLQEGMLIGQSSFNGFESLKARLQLECLETQYKEYSTHTLGDIAEEMNVLRLGDLFEPKENCVYVPVFGLSLVTDDLESVRIRHHNLIQVVLRDDAKSQYVAAFFRSDLGLLILRSLTRGATLPRIGKSDLAHAQVALPPLLEQDEIIHSHSQLEALSTAISKFKKELALNPKSALAIREQVNNMLEQIGGLTDADRVMSMAREGESATIEFKESFSLDVRKGTKEKYIENSSLKTIVAFLNTHGGVLIIGLSDAGELVGIENEVQKFHKSFDAFLLHFKNQLKHRIGEQYYPFIDQRLVDLDGCYVFMIECSAASTPCYLDGKVFYVRTNPATDKLEGPKLVEYVQNHFNR